MCYRMLEKRSDAEQKRLDTTLTTKVEAARDPIPVAIPSEASDKAYFSYMARLQRWIARAAQRETEH